MPNQITNRLIIETSSDRIEAIFAAIQGKDSYDAEMSIDYHRSSPLPILELDDRCFRLHQQES